MEREAGGDGEYLETQEDTCAGHDPHHWVEGKGLEEREVEVPALSMGLFLEGWHPKPARHQGPKQVGRVVISSVLATKSKAGGLTGRLELPWGSSDFFYPFNGGREKALGPVMGNRV